jgi:hypothetical protein
MDSDPPMDSDPHSNSPTMDQHTKDILLTWKSPKFKHTKRKAFRKIYATTSKKKMLLIFTHLFAKISPSVTKEQLHANKKFTQAAKKIVTRLANEPSYKTIHLCTQQYIKTNNSTDIAGITQYIKNIFPARNIDKKIDIIKKAIDNYTCA